MDNVGDHDDQHDLHELTGLESTQAWDLIPGRCSIDWTDKPVRQVDQILIHQ